MKPICPWILTTVVIAASLGAPAQAADGDIYRCLVNDFRSGGPDFSKDASFEQANRRKTFDIFDLGSKFTIMANSPDFKPGTDDYMITQRGILGDSASASSSISSETLVLYAPPASADNQRIKATLVGQSASSVNIWYLTCAKAN